MKKEAAILLVISILIISSIIFTSAQDEEPQIDMPKAGITPGSIFYGFDVFFDNVRAALTFRSINRAKVRLQIMEERMAEMEEMAENNKTEEAEEAGLQVQKQMQKFDDAVEKVKNKDAPELQEHIQNYNARLEERKQRLVDWGEPDYADAIAEAIEMLQELENAIISLPDDLDPESAFKISLLCQEEGATTAEECEEMVAGGLLIIRYSIMEPHNISDIPTDPYNCSDFWATQETQWCCEDPDGGMHFPETVEHYYRKETVEYKIINLETKEIEQGIETDSCDGNTLTEWQCGIANAEEQMKRYSEQYECPLGCQNGACLPREIPQEEEFEGECTDSDGGKDYYVKGTTTGMSSNNAVSSQIDTCLDDSYLGELFCGDNNEVNIIRYLCPNGCEDGVCI